MIIGAAALFWQRRRPEPPTIIDVAVHRHMRAPTIRSAEIPTRVSLHRRVLTEDGVVRWGGILTARTELAVYDLLAVEGPALLDDAIRQRWLTLPMVQQVHRTAVTGRGTTVRAAVITAAATGGISEGERLLHQQLRAAGITGWRANRTIRAGRRTRAGDAVFDELKLVIEVDGFAFHSSHQRFHDDRSRQNDLVGSDWAVLRFTWWHLKTIPIQPWLRSGEPLRRWSAASDRRVAHDQSSSTGGVTVSSAAAARAAWPAATAEL